MNTKPVDLTEILPHEPTNQLKRKGNTDIDQCELLVVRTILLAGLTSSCGNRTQHADHLHVKFESLSDLLVEFADRRKNKAAHYAR